MGGLSITAVFKTIAGVPAVRRCTVLWPASSYITFPIGVTCLLQVNELAVVAVVKNYVMLAQTDELGLHARKTCMLHW